MALLFGRFRVEGASMVPLLASGQRLLVGRLPYMVGRPARGDVVVVRHPRHPRMLLVKQLAGLPGDRIAVQAGGIVVNDTEFPSAGPAQRTRHREWRLGSGEYFVAGRLGEDSRAFGPVPRGAIVGKVWFSYWPPVRWGALARSAIQADVSKSAQGLKSVH